MNPAVAMWINWGLTAALAGFSAFTASGGHPDATTIVGGVAAAATALNGLMHGYSSPQAGPLGK